MRALLFLTVRTFINGIKRAFSSPRRLIGTLFFLAYYVWMFRPFWSGRTSDLATAGIPTQHRFEFPPLQAVEALVFAAFCAVTLVLALGLFSYRGGFKPADVDVLFPTPISPKTVMMMRLGRDYLLTLIVPLILTIFVYRPASNVWTMLFKQVPHPELAGYAFRAIMVSWILTSLAWVALGYAASLFFGRPEIRYDNVRRIGYSVYAVLMVGVPGFVIWQAFSHPTVKDLIGLSESPALRGFFFLASGATNLSMAPLNGSWASAAAGGGMLLGAIALGIVAALRQSPWLYEQATFKSTDAARARQLQARGDVYGMLAEKARTGQVKIGKRSWVHRLRYQGPKALIWKEILLQSRTAKFFVLLFPIIACVMSVMPVIAANGKEFRSIGYVFLMMLMLALFVVSTVTSQSGYTELLRRVDLLKPMPFKPSMTIFVEVSARSLQPCAVCLPAPIVLLFVAPSLWSFSVAALVLMPGIALLLSSYMVAMILLFPDVDDPTQRGFRGLVTMLGILLMFGPSVGIFAALTYFHWPPYLAALPVLALNLGLTSFAAILAGNLYTSFNPSE